MFGCALLSLSPYRLWPYIAGGLVAGAVLFWYHDAAFGSPFATPYAYQNPLFTAPGGGFLELPKARVLAHITITPYRGIFVYSPAILLGLFGACCAWRDRDGRPLDVLRRRRTLAGVAVAGTRPVAVVECVVPHVVGRLHSWSALYHPCSCALWTFHCNRVPANSANRFGACGSVDTQLRGDYSGRGNAQP